MVKKKAKKVLRGGETTEGGSLKSSSTSLNKAGKSSPKKITKKKTATKKTKTKAKVIRKKVTIKKSVKNSQGKKSKNANGKPTENQSAYRTPDGKWKPGVTQPGSKAWKPGESGNPAGRPKGRMLGDILREHLFEPVKDKEGNPLELAPGVAFTRADAIVFKLVERASEGSFHHMKEIMERVDGKVPSKLDAMITDKTDLADKSDEELERIAKAGRKRKAAMAMFIADSTSGGDDGES